jgi:SAM-dependent methyltransferase
MNVALAGVTDWIADFGCGEGIFAGLSSRYLGLDRDGAWASRLVRAGKLAATADIHYVPLRDGSLGGVLCMNVLGICDPGNVIAEIDRVLRPGGRVYLKNRWHKGSGEPQGFLGRLGRTLHLHHLRFWNHGLAHQEGRIAWVVNANGTRAICPRCVRRFFLQRGYVVDTLSSQVFVLTKPVAR